MSRIFQLLAPLVFSTTIPVSGKVLDGQVVAVLSSETGPYREALEGLKQELGESLPYFVLSRGEPAIPDSTRVVVAFGSKAALSSYSRQVTLLYGMAPGMMIDNQDSVKIWMMPRAPDLLANLKKIYPALKRLGVFWQSSLFKEYVGELRQVAASKGIIIEDIPLKNSKDSALDVPDHLRNLYGKIDAIWLPPDPLMLNATSLPIFMEFSRSNKVPFFVPTGGLVEQGATASVGPTFREMGRTAGIAARKILDGTLQEKGVYVTNVEMVINKTIAAQVGLQIPEEVLRKADRVVP